MYTLDRSMINKLYAIVAPDGKRFTTYCLTLADADAILTHLNRK